MERLKPLFLQAGFLIKCKRSKIFPAFYYIFCLHKYYIIKNIKERSVVMEVAMKKEVLPESEKRD
jgi:hypothetical protein